MNKNKSLSIDSEYASDMGNGLQDDVLNQSAYDIPVKTFYRNDALTKLSPEMAQAIRESIEVSFGK